jgi:hypothetical protein
MGGLTQRAPGEDHPGTPHPNPGNPFTGTDSVRILP